MEIKIRRAPAIPTPISKLEDGARVAIVGTIVNKNEEVASFLIDDGSDKVIVLVNNPDDFDRYKEGDYIRVIGKVWGNYPEAEIQAEIIQDFNSINKELYHKFFLKR